MMESTSTISDTSAIIDVRETKGEEKGEGVWEEERKFKELGGIQET